MNIGHHNDSPGQRADARDFDAGLRQLHARALEHMPVRTLMQLRPQQPASRLAATQPRRLAWPLAATCAIALVAGGLFLRHPTHTVPADTGPATAITDGEPGDVYATLDESPELYLWLASSDTTSLVSE